MAQKGKRKTKKRTVGSILLKVLLWFFMLIFIAAFIAGLILYKKYGAEILHYRTEAMLIAAKSDKSDFSSNQTSICYYSDGSVMQTLSGAKNVYYLPYNSIPKAAINAFIAIEDRKFYSHKGYDIYAIARAAKAYIKNDGAIKQGGSTITQQLARTIYLNNEKTVERKVTEIFLSAALERKYSKKDILEFYINNVYFANGYYGLQAAAKGYFNVTAGDLSLSQLAFLCSIPNNPTTYNPRTNIENTLARRDRVLDQMYELGYISAEEYKAALDEIIILVETLSETNNYEETFTYRCAIRAIMQAEGFALRYSFESDEDKALYQEFYEEEYSRIWRNLYAKGYRIYTSINPTKQELLQETIDEELSEFTEVQASGVYKLQASGVCIDNDTGFVVAIVGGRSQESVGYTLNRAFQSPRQPGSSIKPLIVYTPAFEAGYYPDTTVVDEKFEGGPTNSGDTYSGEIDVRYAVAVSKNTIAWKLLEELGVEKGLSYLLKMNFAHIVDTDYYPAAALGGLTYGATALEMTSAYACLENSGIYRTPTCIVRITDTYGEEIVNNSSDKTTAVKVTSEKRIYMENAANIMTDVLTTVMESGTGRKVSLEGMTCAGKTGTTKDAKDGWFVGYTSYYTTGIWVGCDMPEEVEGLKGSSYPGRIWQAYMQEIHEGLEDRAFTGYIDDRPKEDDSYPYGWIDTDGDGIPDDYPYGWVDTDGDEIPDGYPPEWVDNDGDEVPDGYPIGWTDTDGDGIPDGYPYGWVDLDGDGIPDGYPYGWVDLDGDGTPDGYPADWDFTGENTDNTVNNGNSEIIWVTPNNNVDEDNFGIEDNSDQAENNAALDSNEAVAHEDAAGFDFDENSNPDENGNANENDDSGNLEDGIIWVNP